MCIAINGDACLFQCWTFLYQLDEISMMSFSHIIQIFELFWISASANIFVYFNIRTIQCGSLADIIVTSTSICVSEKEQKSFVFQKFAIPKLFMTSICVNIYLSVAKTLFYTNKIMWWLQLSHMFKFFIKLQFIWSN